MIERIYNKVKFPKDETANAILNFLRSKIGDREDCYCLYEEPDFLVENGVLPTFTIVDREWGVIFIKGYNYTAERLTEMNENYWVISENKEINEIKYFDNYCYKCKTDIMSPLNGIDNELKFTSFIIFTNLEKERVKIHENFMRNIWFSDYISGNMFDNMCEHRLDDDNWKRLLSVIEKANVLAKDIGIPIEKPAKNLREAIAINNQKIYTFDETQLEASLSITDACEQIRGLAGTGKTVILAIKAAKIHRYDPNAKIAYVFYTQSLYTQVTRLIQKYYVKLTGVQPSENLKILHAWGGRTTGEGLLYNVCRTNGLSPIPYYEVRGYSNPFGEACKRVSAYNLRKEYDYVLIDEAQDLPEEFFYLVAKIVKDPKKIVIAYDQLQTTTDVSMPDFEELFGKDKNGEPQVKLLEENDHILKKSYRNYRDVLLIAMAFGFGIYAVDGMVQMIRSVKNWKALGFDFEKINNVGDDISFSSRVIVERTKENSPNEINQLYEKYPIVNFDFYSTINEEYQRVSEKIDELITQEKVKPEDIMVIDLRKKSKELLQRMQELLYKKGHLSIIPGIVEDSKNFFQDECVTLTTPRRAKGNEVRLIYYPCPNELMYDGYLDKMKTYIRLEYTEDRTQYSAVSHPKAHIHIGNYNDLRIGVKRVPTLSEFMELIMYLNYHEDWIKIKNVTSEDELIKMVEDIIRERKEMTVQGCLESYEEQFFSITL
jgi:superfamily I DNA and RNA helicase